MREPCMLTGTTGLKMASDSLILIQPCGRVIYWFPEMVAHHSWLTVGNRQCGLKAAFGFSKGKPVQMWERGFQVFCSMHEAVSISHFLKVIMQYMWHVSWWTLNTPLTTQQALGCGLGKICHLVGKLSYRHWWVAFLLKETCYITRLQPLKSYLLPRYLLRKVTH